MELEVAQQLGLVPPAPGVAGSSPGGTPSSEGALPSGDRSPAADGLLGAQRYANMEEGSPPPEDTGSSTAPTEGSVEQRLAALEQENQRLRSQIGTQVPEDPVQAAQAYMTQKTQEIDQQALAAYYGLVNNEVAQGTMTQEAAQREIQNLRAAALAQARADAQSIATLPAARLMMAEKIAKEFTVGEIKLTVDDLLPFAKGGPEAMRARAQTLQETRRDTAYQQRAARGTDRAEAGGTGTSIDPRVLDQLSPGQVIKLGIQRGHFA